jgi:hypothetical protein
MGWSDSVQEYCGQDYTSDEFESFWARHQKLLSDITSLRNTYKPEERTYLHGFTDRDYDEDDDDKSWNLDCVFMMRVCSTISSVTDVEKFLGRTKRDYLPIIIKAFMTTPKTDFLLQTRGGSFGSVERASTVARPNQQFGLSIFKTALQSHLLDQPDGG